MTAADVLGGLSRWSLHDGENADFVAGMKEKAFSVTICDPPYSEQVHKTGILGFRRPPKGAAGKVHHAKIGFDPLTSYDFVTELVRVTRRWVLLFCALEQIGAYKEAAGKSYVRSGIYRRGNATPQITGDRPGQACEGIVILHRPGRKRWNGGGSAAFWSANRDPMERVHVTQKPTRLMLDLVGQFSDPGEVIFDPYAGSCTTGVAALRLGRSFVGCERDTDAAQVGRERLVAEDQQISLSAYRAGQLSLLQGAP